MRSWLSLVLLTVALSSSAQRSPLADRLLKEINRSREDTNKVLLYIRLGNEVEIQEPRLAGHYYRLAGDLSARIGYDLGRIKYITNYTYLLNMQGDLDSSVILNLQSVDLSRKIGDSLYLAKTLFNTGTAYRERSEFETAVGYYEEGKRIFTTMGDDNTLAAVNDILQLLYLELHQYKKAIELGEKAVSSLRQLKDTMWLLSALNNLGLSYSEVKDFRKAAAVNNEVLKISVKTGNQQAEQTAYLNLGDNALQEGRYDEMKPYFEKALVITRDLGLPPSEQVALKGLALYYLYQRNYALSMRYATDALAITYRLDLRMERQKMYDLLSNISFGMQDMRAGELYAVMGSDLGDSLLNDNVTKHTLELEKRYETEKKQNQINRMEAEHTRQNYTIERKNILNWALIAGAAILLVILMLVYRTFQQRRKLHLQRISELESEKQLAATEAVLKGEEIERTRLAKDLHDGLGGMLSGIKYSLNTFKGNVILTPENAQAFERSIDMLDSSIQEMRRVAHNMMPENLVKFGLDEALKDFCSDINQSGALQVSYQSIGLKDVMIDQTVSITVYRIVQELINNTMKHSGAANAIVQVTKTDGRLSVTVEDDGKGFDPSILNRAKGIGWSNIQNRVEFLKGRLDVNAGQGQGTSVLIELELGA